MLPIEKGCLAMIINSKTDNDGKVVTIGNYLGEVVGWMHSDRWEIDKEIKGTFGNTSNHASEKILMRIDGYTEETKQKAETIGE